MELVQALENSRNEFSASVSAFSEENVKQRPAPDSWSALECAEHVAIVEGRFLSWLENAERAGVPAQDSARESELAARMSNRERKAQAPEPAKPSGRFATVAEALADFEATRARTIRFANEQGDGLYALATKHPAFGPLNGAELVVLLVAHTRRHRDQVNEVKEILGRP
jgi:uncharacterized damage-inducible protein DinB